MIGEENYGIKFSLTMHRFESFYRPLMTREDYSVSIVVVLFFSQGICHFGRFRRRKL